VRVADPNPDSFTRAPGDFERHGVGRCRIETQRGDTSSIVPRRGFNAPTYRDRQTGTAEP
jgi:hypothetical protein